MTSRSTSESRKPHESEPWTSNVSYGSANFSSCFTHSSQIPAMPLQVPTATATLYLKCQNTQLPDEALVHLQKLYAAERHFSNRDKRKKTRTALFTLLLCAYLNRNKSSSAQFLCFRVHSRTHKTDFVQRVAQGVSHKVANSLQGPASTPRSERRERGKGNKHTLHTLSSE